MTQLWMIGNILPAHKLGNVFQILWVIRPIRKHGKSTFSIFRKSVVVSLKLNNNTMGFLGSIQSTLGIGINARANLGLNMPDSMTNNILGFIEEETEYNVSQAISDLSLYAKLLYCFGTVMTSP